MASNNTLSVTLDIVRAALNRGTKNLTVPRELQDIVEFNIIEQKITAAAAAVVINFGPITTAEGFIIFTPTKVGLHINDVAAAEIECGSFGVFMDTNITSLAIDNDLLATAADVTVEIWLAALTT